MPEGPEYVEATLSKIESISTAIGGLAGVEDEWRIDMQRRLVALAELLRGMSDRFFLKTRVCLPFARKCDQAASGLQELLAEGKAQEDQLESAMETLEKAARVLDERSMMQGMAIT